MEEVEVAPIYQQNITLYQPRPDPSLTVVPYPQEWYFSEMPRQPAHSQGRQPRVMAQTVKTLIMRVAHGDDDCEQKLSTGKTSLHDDDLDLREGRLVGLRFQNVDIKPRQRVTSAILEFHSKLEKNDNCEIDVYGHHAGNSSPFGHELNCLSNRLKTHAVIHWTPQSWVPGTDHYTEDLAPIIQEIVNHPQWHEGNSFTLIFHGTSGHRSAWAFDGNPSLAPQLILKLVETEAHELPDEQQHAQASMPPPSRGPIHHQTGNGVHEGYDCFGHSRPPAPPIHDPLHLPGPPIWSSKTSSATSATICPTSTSGPPDWSAKSLRALATGWRGKTPWE